LPSSGSFIELRREGGQKSKPPRNCRKIWIGSLPTVKSKELLVYGPPSTPKTLIMRLLNKGFELTRWEKGRRTRALTSGSSTSSRRRSRTKRKGTPRVIRFMPYSPGSMARAAGSRLDGKYERNQGKQCPYCIDGQAPPIHIFLRLFPPGTKKECADASTPTWRTCGQDGIRESCRLVDPIPLIRAN